METILQGGNHLERQLTPEPVAAPAAGAAGLHLALAAAVALYGAAMGLFHHNIWGSKGSGGAMQVTLTSALPLPADQMNQNVLATETPSQAPALPSPKQQSRSDEEAIPIRGKQAKENRDTLKRIQQHQPQPTENNVARYGEQAGTSMPRAIEGGGSIGPTAVGDADFASRFGWYVNQINAKMSTSWNKAEVDPHTPRGTRVYLVFTIHRDGSPAGVALDRSSGSPTLDRSCQRGVQRVDTFGTLPASYNQSTLKVSYYCEY